jgi:predicted ABC-type transport system involved in lysophospholipase L1 biosynthesis ATPase subunit
MNLDCFEHKLFVVVCLCIHVLFCLEFAHEATASIGGSSGSGYSSALLAASAGLDAEDAAERRRRQEFEEKSR